MRNNIRNVLTKKRKILYISILFFLLIALALSVFLINRQTNTLSNAASIATIEPENGVLSGNVSVINDQGVSGGKYVRFAVQETLKPTCTDKLQDKINAATSGQTILVRTDCIYREQILINKSLTLDGQGGAQIRGSDVWDNATWTQSGNTWVSNKVVPVLPTHGDCTDENGVNVADDQNYRCRWAEQVFVDSLPLKQVSPTSTPTSGEFSVNSSRQIVLADNPLGKTVEVTMRQYWMRPGANNVTVKNFTMKHAAVDSQAGAISTKDSTTSYSNWTIQNNILSDAHGAVVSLSGGTGHKLLNNDISRGGQLGVHGNNGGSTANNHLIQGNKIHDNHTEKFNIGWEAGGLKMAGKIGDIWDANEVYDNNGPGLWCDINCKSLTISNNSVYNNNRSGIFFEISDGAKIFGNKVWENGWGNTNFGWGGAIHGIMISSSRNAEVYNNIVAWNPKNISILSQCRSGGKDTNGNCLEMTNPWNNVTGNYIHDNTIISMQGFDLLGYFADFTNNVLKLESSQNRGANNKYWFSSPDGTGSRWELNGLGRFSKLADWNATFGEENGRYLTEAEKNQILQDANIPKSPQSH